jgi:hypothetical protein
MANAIIIDDLGHNVKSIYPIDYPNVEIKTITHDAIFKDILPFRVKFTAIQIEGLSSNPPAIPFQVIGYSNYIL